ncbi:hypothetical protein [Streptomyces sp. NL15-2K]|uniref:hypothetical protein n=1 Tax=Streptomyces sp. NL15-2K TaxID=376149 RepID=UPI000F57C5AD|nr:MULTISPECIES: hypothetical protein [Actinomycetes]WKX08894.1 hypothetical protein Q4V64_15910 [Kutzneria buriramensis]GCB49614.1 hypothetical protein SNL152K_6953 [Streptomyces sp. NL15-2K]
MTRLRSALVTAAAAALFTVGAAVGTASAAPTDGDDPRVAAAGCAELVGSGEGWAAIYNQCGHGIYASVEVDWADPACIYIDPWTTGYITLEPGDVPYYAYEC